MQAHHFHNLSKNPCVAYYLLCYAIGIMTLKRQWVTREELRKERPWLSNWMLAKFRKERLVPYLKIGHKTILYDADRVERALSRLEVQEVS